MEKTTTKPARYYYALLYPRWNFADSYELIRDWDTAEIERYPSKALRDEAVESDSRLVSISAKDAAYIASGNLKLYFSSRRWR